MKWVACQPSDTRLRPDRINRYGYVHRAAAVVDIGIPTRQPASIVRKNVDIDSALDVQVADQSGVVEKSYSRIIAGGYVQAADCVAVAIEDGGDSVGGSAEWLPVGAAGGR